MLLNTAEVDRVYACSSEARIHVASVSHSGLAAFSYALRCLDRSLGDIGDDRIWEWIIRFLRRYRFNICASPLPFDHPAVRSEDYEQRLSQIKSTLAAYPSQALLGHEVLKCLESLYSVSKNPLLVEFLRLRQADPKLALLLKESRLIGAVDEYLQSIGFESTIISPSELRQHAVYDQLVIIGAPQWYPSYVIDSPRAATLTFLNFDSVKGDWNWTPTLVNAVVLEPLRSRQVKLASISYSQKNEGTEQDDIYPVVRLEKIEERTLASSTVGAGRGLDGRLVLLDNGYAVFISAQAETKVFSIDLDADIEYQVTQKFVRDLVPGSYILLRASGGGDYVSDVADALLGENASRLRETQARWKQMLRDHIEEFGIELVAEELERLGATKATPGNVNNWISPGFIRQQAPEDLLAVLELICWVGEPDRLIQEMDAIRRAHIHAGKLIRKELIDLIQQEDLGDLTRLGHQEFQLNSGSGCLAGFRILEILQTVLPVPGNRLLVPFQWEDEQWPE